MRKAYSHQVLRACGLQVDTLVMKHFLSGFSDDDAKTILKHCNEVLPKSANILLLQVNHFPFLALLAAHLSAMRQLLNRLKACFLDRRFYACRLSSPKLAIRTTTCAETEYLLVRASSVVVHRIFREVSNVHP